MKHGVRSFPDKRSELTTTSFRLLHINDFNDFCIIDPGAERFRFMFTLRDTPVDYINVTCWASDSSYINTLHSSFKIGDVGETIVREC